MATQASLCYPRSPAASHSGPNFVKIAESFVIRPSDDADELLSLLSPDHKQWASKERVRYFEARVRRSLKRMQQAPPGSEYVKNLVEYERDSKNLEFCRRALEEKRAKSGRTAEIDKLIAEVQDFQLEIGNEADVLTYSAGHASTKDADVSRLARARTRYRRAKADYNRAKTIIAQKLLESGNKNAFN